MQRQSLLKQLSIAFLSLLAYSPISSAEIGDVHGRELDILGLGFLGHIGIEHKENSIIEMGGHSIDVYSPLRMISDVRRITPEEFHNFSPSWGVRYLDDQAERSADLAWKTWFIGADFTISRRYRRSGIKRDSRGRLVALKGFYRCDSLVLDSYQRAGYKITLDNVPLLLPYNVFRNGFPFKRTE